MNPSEAQVIDVRSTAVSASLCSTRPVTGRLHSRRSRCKSASLQSSKTHDRFPALEEVLEKVQSKNVASEVCKSGPKDFLLSFARLGFRAPLLGLARGLTWLGVVSQVRLGLARHCIS